MLSVYADHILTQRVNWKSSTLFWKVQFQNNYRFRYTMHMCDRKFNNTAIMVFLMNNS